MTQHHKMAERHNIYDRQTLEKIREQEDFKRKTISFYRYVHIADAKALRDELYLLWYHQNVLGRVYLASEGINAQISIPEPQFEAFLAKLNDYPAIRDMKYRPAVEDDDISFLKLVVKVRKNIVADGLAEGTYDSSNVGKHLSAEEFNRYLEDPKSIAVDMRNFYESEIGHFEDAWCPEVSTFRESLPIIKQKLDEHKDKKLLLYCTGGVRCEKASAYFKKEGFKDVNQLFGGIIHYTHQVKEKNLNNKFRGKNFVFDERMGERISEDIIGRCHQCGEACDMHTNCANDACHLLFIQCEECKKKYQNCCSKDCAKVLSLDEETQRLQRKGKVLKDAKAIYKSPERPKGFSREI